MISPYSAGNTGTVAYVYIQCAFENNTASQIPSTVCEHTWPINQILYNDVTKLWCEETVPPFSSSHLYFNFFSPLKFSSLDPLLSSAPPTLCPQIY